MSFQTFVTERLKYITETLNAIGINAKKIDELPVQSTLDPTSKIHVSKSGTSESLSIQKIIDEISENNFSKLLEVGEITVSGLTISVPADAMWVYEGVNYQTAAITTITETLCATGFLRKDILVANQSNEIVLIKGDESETIRILPNVPVGTVYVTEIDVDDAVVGTPTAPILNGDYIPKIDKSHILLQSSGVLNFHPFAFKAKYNGIVLDGTYTSLGGVSYSTPSSSLYSGRKLTIRNNQSTPVTLLHNSSLAAVKFMFPNEVDFVIKSKEVIEFIYRPNTSSTGWYDYVGNINDIPTIEVADVVGLTAELAAKLDASSYNQHFKGKYTTSGALTTAHPTATDGDYAIVDSGTGVDAKEWIWDNEAGWIVGGATGASTTDALTEGSTNLYWTVARFLANLTAANIKAALGITTLSGSNTGDQDLSGKQDYLGYSPENGDNKQNSLAADVSGQYYPTVDAVNNGLALKVDKNTAITGATKTKITYDSKGLVTSGADATTADVPEGSNLYFTTARVLATLLTGISFATGGAIVSTDSILVAFGKIQKQITDALTSIGLKQDTLVSGTNIKTINSTSILGSGNIAISGSVDYTELNRIDSANIDYVALGDSITAGQNTTSATYGYANYLQTTVGFKSFTNLAVSGVTTIHNGIDGELYTQVAAIPVGTDLITVMIGVNDFFRPSIIGNLESVLAKTYASLDKSASFAEAFRFNLETIKINFPLAKILVITPIQTNYAGSSLGLKAYIDIEIAICNFLAIPVCDVYNRVLSGSDTSLLPDAIHPTDAGHILLANAVLSEIISPRAVQANPLVFNQTKKYIEISSATTLSDIHNNRDILVTANCTVNIPNGITFPFNCTFDAMTGVTLTFTFGGSVVVTGNIANTMTNGLCLLKSRDTANNYRLRGAI